MRWPTERKIPQTRAAASRAPGEVPCHQPYLCQLVQSVGFADAVAECAEDRECLGSRVRGSAEIRGQAPCARQVGEGGSALGAPAVTFGRVGGGLLQNTSARERPLGTEDFGQSRRQGDSSARDQILGGAVGLKLRRDGGPMSPTAGIREARSPGVRSAGTCRFPRRRYYRCPSSRIPR